MQTISLYDELSIEPSSNLVIEAPAIFGINEFQENLVYRAADKLLHRAGGRCGAKIRLTKRIPVAAGLGGGSADAAAALRGLNTALDLCWTVGDLVNLGAEIGTDIPFCVIGGTALGQGRGERLTLLPPAPCLWLVLVRPPRHLATARVYRVFDTLETVIPKDDSSSLQLALEEGNEDAFVAGLVNDLEPAVFHLCPEVRDLRDFLLNHGARRALVSGSGPTVYGITRGEEEAIRLAGDCEGYWKDVFVAHT